jgi:hypothetical protein
MTRTQPKCRRLHLHAPAAFSATGETMLSPSLAQVACPLRALLSRAATAGLEAMLMTFEHQPGARRPGHLSMTAHRVGDVIATNWLSLFASVEPTRIMPSRGTRKGAGEHFPQRLKPTPQLRMPRTSRV